MGKEFKGYVLLHKSLLESAIWNRNEVFDRRSAWIDLILRANYEDKTVMSETCDQITVHRGQLLTSQSKLAERWNWSKSKVHRFLGTLKNAEMLFYETVEWGKGGTLITIHNYEYYQDFGNFGNANGTQTERKPTSSRNASHAQLNKYKEIKVNKVKGGDDRWR